MKIILLKDIKKLGNKNDIKNVADGYAMNFLIPQKMAVAATSDRVRELEDEKNKTKNQEIKKSKELDELASKLQNKKVVIKKDASDKGKLFAALSTDEILTAIDKSLQIRLDKSNVKTKEYIKEIGEHQVPLEIQGKTVIINLEVKK